MSYLFPFAGGAAGWLANWLLCEIILSGIKKRRPEIAVQAGALAGGAFDMRLIAGKLTDPSKLIAVKPIIEGHVDTFLKIKLQEKMPAIAMFVGGSTLDKLKDGLLEEIDILLPEVIAAYAQNMVQDIDIPAIISKKIMEMPASKLIGGIRKTFSRELILIKVYGFFAGFVTGLLLLLMTLL